MSYKGMFEMTEEGLVLLVHTQHGNTKIINHVRFSWDILTDESNLQRFMNKVIAGVVSRTLASIEDSNG